MRFILTILFATVFFAGLTGAGSGKGMRHDRDWLNKILNKKKGEVVISATGDLIFTKEISRFKGPAYTNLCRILRESDIAYGNLEMSLNSKSDSGVYRFVRKKEFVWEISRAGFTLLGLANNHQLDYGRSGLKECLSILKGAGIRYAGGGMNYRESVSPAYIKTGHTTVAFLSFYSEEFQSLRRPDTDRPSIATVRAPRVSVEKEDGSREIILAPLESDVRQMGDAISIARRHADIVMVAIHVHWLDHARMYGIPDSVPPNQAILFRGAVDAGADIVLGTGPHVLRGIEFYKKD